MEKQNIRSEIQLQGWPGKSREILEEPEGVKPSERRLPDLITKALEAFEARLHDEDFKPTLAEYLKLLQVEREQKQKDEGPREITVTWVEPESDYLEE